MLGFDHSPGRVLRVCTLTPAAAAARQPHPLCFWAHAAAARWAISLLMYRGSHGVDALNPGVSDKDDTQTGGD